MFRIEPRQQRMGVVEQRLRGGRRHGDAERDERSVDVEEKQRSVRETGHPRRITVPLTGTAPVAERARPPGEGHGDRRIPDDRPGSRDDGICSLPVNRDPLLRALIRNPSVPEELLLRFVEQADPSLVRHLSHRVGLPLTVIDAMARHREPEVRRVVPTLRNAPPETISMLAGDPDPRVRLEVLSRAYELLPIPEAAWRALAADPRRGVREEIATNDDVPAAVKLLLADDPEFGDLVVLRHGSPAQAQAVYERVLTEGHPEAIMTAATATGRTPPPELIARLVAEPATRVAAAGFDESHANQLAHDTDERVRRQLAADLRLPATAAEILAADPDTSVRQALAQNAATPLAVLRRLADEGDRWMRIRVFSNESASEELLASIDLPVADNDTVPAVGWLRRRCADVDLQARYARSPHVIFRRTVAYCPHLPADVVAELAEDDDFAVRLLLAEHHPDAPGELLVRMVQVWDGYTTPAMVRRPQFPADALDRFTCSELEHHRRLATYSDRLTEEQKARLRADPVPAIRERFDPDFPPAAELRAMLDDPDPEVRSRAAGHRNLPVQLMWKIFESAVPPR